MFDIKMFSDSGEREADASNPYPLVQVSGTLTGDGLAYPNNTQIIECAKNNGLCESYGIEQIGDRQLGRLSNLGSYEIKKWSASEIVAVVDEAMACIRTTLTIDRKSKIALLVQEPANQTRIECKDSDNKIYKWTIEDSPAWKRMKKNTAGAS